MAEKAQVNARPENSHEAELVASLYRQAISNGYGAVVGSVCLVAVMWPFGGHPALLAWLSLTLLVIAARLPLLRLYERDASRVSHARRWAWRYTAVVLANGACWSAAGLLLLPAHEPLAVASFLIVVGLVAAGSIASQSFHLPAVLGFVALAVVPLVAHMLFWQESGYVLPAATLLLFLSFLMANARIQNKRIREGIALRLRTESLVDELRLEKQESDRQRTRAEQANLAKSHFLAAASHDLRQPLHAVGLFSASLRELVPDGSARAIADSISESVESLESLFNELLDLSQLEAGSLQIKMADFPIELLLSRLRTRFGPLAAEKRLALDVPTSHAIVRSDPVQLERLLGNLLANAIQYTERGTVSIACATQVDEVRVAVCDTGIGIPQQHRERIFDALFQIGNPARDRRKGRGLGLAIVRRLSDMLGHRIEVASEDGVGSTFGVVLPVGDPARVQEQPAQANVPTDLLRGRSVLIVDDEPSVRTAMQELLARWGCRAYCAADHAQALTVARESPLDFVIADLRLGGGAGGGEVIHAVRSVARTDIGALLVTGDTSPEAVQVAQHQQCALLHKPVSPARLRSVLTHLAASRLA